MALAKKYQFSLETKVIKPLKEKTFTCYNTDTVNFEIEVMEEDDYKYLDEFETKIEVIYSYPNGEIETPIKQTIEDGGIEIIPDSTISIIPLKGCLFPTDYLRIDINIYDEDEFISLQPFIFKVYKSKEGEIVDENKEIFQTIYDIKKEMLDLSERMVELSERVEEVMSQINIDIEESTSNMILALEQINLRVNECEQKANTINDDLDNYFLRNIVLSPLVIDNNVIFTTNINENIKPIDLLNKAFILTVNGSSYNANIRTTHVSVIYFTLNNNIITINYVILANKSIQGKSLSITPQFNNNTNNINKDETGFNILIKTNILGDFIETSSCTLASTSNHIQNN